MMDIRYERTEALIHKAVEELAQKKDIHSLTVTEIAKKAGISRIAFYDHYENVDALAEHMEDALCEKFSTICGPFMEFTVSPEKIIRRIVQYYKSADSSFLLTRENHSRISQKSIDMIIREIIETTGNTDPGFEIRVTMLITGIFGVFQRKDITDEKILKHLCTWAEHFMK